jgi:predicted O-methyltransferase YrrM
MDNAYFNFPDFYRQVASRTDWTRFVEVGVYTGASVCFLAQELKKRGAAAFDLYAVDLWERANETGYSDLKMDLAVWNTFCQRMQQTNTTKNIQVMKVDSVMASKLFQNESVDFVFIDADHSYEAVRQDIEVWLPKIKPGGMLAGHDYGEPCGVKQAVDEKFGPRVKTTGSVWFVDVPRGTFVNNQV